MIDFGIVKPGTTLYIPFATYDSNDPTASVTMSGLATSDIEIYKDGGITQRASDSGYALLDTDGIDFDSVTGIHGFSVDLADNTTAGFYASGSQYFIVVSSITVDAGTISFIAARFTLGQPNADHNTTIATLATQTSFTLTTGPAEDNALATCVCYIHDVASAIQGSYAVVSAYTGATKTVTLTEAPSFTIAASDNISFYAPVNTKWIGATAQTARDIGASVLLSSGTGTGQISLSSGTVSLTADQAVNTTKWGGTAVASARPTVDIDTIKTQSVTCNAGVTVGAYVGGTGAAALASEVTPARMGALTDLIDDGRLDVILDTVAANVAGLGGAAMRGTDNAATAGAQMDLVNAPNATAVTAIQAGLATPTNITAGTITTVTNLTNLPAVPNDWLTAAGIAADVGTEFAAAILGGEITELTSVPGASPSLKQAVALLYMALRNKRDTTSSTDTITNDAGTTIATASLSDNGTTFTKAEYL